MSEHKELATQESGVALDVFEVKKTGLAANLPEEMVKKHDVMAAGTLPDTSKAKMVSINTMAQPFSIEIGQSIDFAVMGFTKQLMKSLIPSQAALGVMEEVPLALVSSLVDGEVQVLSISSSMLRNELARMVSRGDVVVGSSAVMVRATRIADGKSKAGLGYHRYKTQLINVAFDEQF